MKKPSYRFILLGFILCAVLFGAEALPLPSADTAAFKPDLIFLQPQPPSARPDTAAMPSGRRTLVADSARVDLPAARSNISGGPVRYRITPRMPVDSALLFVRHSRRVDTLGVFAPSGGAVEAAWDCANTPDQDGTHLQFGYVLYADSLAVASPPMPQRWCLLRERGKAREKPYNIKQLTRPGEFEIDCGMAKWGGANGEPIGDIGQFKMLWTGATLYFIAQIRDSSITYDDFVELHFDIRRDRADFPDANHRSLRFGPLTRSRVFAGEYVDGQGYAHSDEISQSLIDGMKWKAAVDSAGGGYVVEAAVPFPLLSDRVFPPPLIGFDVSVMNVDRAGDTGTVESFYSWAGAERFARYSPSRWGTGRTTQAALALKIVFVLVLVVTCAVPPLIMLHIIVSNRKQGREDQIADASENEPLTEKVIALVEENLSDAGFGIDRVVKSAGATEDEIVSAIRRDLDCAFEQLLAFRRIKRSQRLMRDAALDIEKIAALCGFASVGAYREEYTARMTVDPEISRAAMLEKLREEEREAEEDDD